VTHSVSDKKQMVLRGFDSHAKDRQKYGGISQGNLQNRVNEIFWGRGGVGIQISDLKKK